MGCDIHPIVEFKRGGRWHLHDGPWLCYDCDGESPFWKQWGRNRGCYACNDIGSTQTPWRQRNYDVFGMLAGVRTGDWDVISVVRGLPRDISPTVDQEKMGDHSQGFVTLSELHLYDWWQTVTKEGTVGLSVFARWDQVTPPVRYSRGVGGGDIKHLTVAQAREHLTRHEAPPLCLDYFEPLYVVGCEWLETAAQCAGNFITFVAEMTSAAKRLDVSPDHIRYVFGFDS
jgi:hypothetical protein